MLMRTPKGPTEQFFIKDYDSTVEDEDEEEGICASYNK